MARKKNNESVNFIEVRGGREHNLKGVDVDIPRDKFVVISGVSGSGKSSLAFDTIYAEGQRRYVESLSSYARQFLGQMKKPKVDAVNGIPPAVAIQQKGPGYNPRSTVGTLTEIYDYLRLLFARIGVPHCPECGRKIQSQSLKEIVNKIVERGSGEEVEILAPLIRGRKGTYKELFDRLRSEGFITVEVDGKSYSLEEEIELNGRLKHDINIIVDKVNVTGSESNEERITDSVEIALKKTTGTVAVKGLSDEIEIFSKHYACPICGISIGEIEPRSFSFNSPYGACSSCSGLGVKLVIDRDLIVPDKSLSINQQAIKPWASQVSPKNKKWQRSVRSYRYQMIKKVSEMMEFSLDTPFKKLPKKVQETLLHGSKEVFNFKIDMGGNKYSKTSRFEGVISELSRRYLQTDSEYIREMIRKDYMREMECPECKGSRLKKESLAVKIEENNISDLTNIPVSRLLTMMQKLELTESEVIIAKKILEELESRLNFLVDVGVDYVSLSRKANTLSSGESERIRLATQIGSSLVGVAYIFDEPTVGLHARDTDRLLNSLVSLQKLGNTVIVVEHDPETISRP